ncbi:hypothetical protein [Slackia piriformis]|uniref:hypothetical protein n=1 Tax=Slackia piriformis TaxID=626934 RepID=UPI0039F4B75B
MKPLLLKIGAAAAGVALMGCLFGCSSPQAEQQGDAASEESEVVTYNVGDTVETDLVRLTLNDSALAVALNNSLPIGTGFNIENDYFCPKEYVAEEDADNAFVAPKGSTLVYYELLVENLDREPLELDSSFDSDNDFVTVTYNGTTYIGSDFEEKEYGWTARDVEGEQDWDSSPVSSLLAGVEGKDLFRGYVEAPFEPESLEDSFEITFNLPTSDGSFESFAFVANE